MKFVIMCGGKYDTFKTPKQLSVINGERVVDRTIRLLRENGVNEIFISTNDKRFESCGVPILKHKNSYKFIKGELKGYWLDAFYPNFDEREQVTFLFGDVYYMPSAIELITKCNLNKNILFGSKAAKNIYHKNWGEPFAYYVADYKTFMDGVKAVKKLQDEGKLLRVALVWELYRYLNNLDVNVQDIKDDTFIVIDDGTIDIDAPFQIEEYNRRFTD